MRNDNILTRILQDSVIGALAVLGLQSCMVTDAGNPYADSLHSLEVALSYPENPVTADNAVVKVESTLSSSVYEMTANDSHIARMQVPEGIYRLSVSQREGNLIFNGIAEGVRVNRDTKVSISLKQSEAGSLLIKEIYSGGCSKYPLEGNYQSDKYMIIHNNDNIPACLDGLCFGTYSPYNSTANNPWTSVGEDGAMVFKDYAPIIQAIWQIGGSGKDFPLQPGEDAVIALNGAIDHSAQFPNSVNLNQSSYFACYNQVMFPNTTYHPAPGDKIREDHIVNVLVKTGQANAYTISLSSPVMVIFRAKDVDIKEFVQQPENIIQVPGSTENVVAIPLTWIVDGVEVFDGRSSSNNKRLSPVVDAGFATLSTVYQGHSLMRKTDEKASAEAGYEVLVDTNNSSDDFYESEVQSLHK